MSNIITSKHLEKGVSYQAYRKLIDELLSENKTTGENHSEAYINYTKMNVQRMKRLDKTISIMPELEKLVLNISEDQIWFVILEAWCGDAAQNVPIIAKIAALNPKIELKLILRDENLEVMDAYLTNGGRSIPKVIFLKSDLEEFATWGPRPQMAQQMVEQFKKEGVAYEKSSEAIHRWYAKDKGKELQKEFYVILKDFMG